MSRAVLATCLAACLTACLPACSADAGPESPSQRAKQFYTALNTEDFAAARAMLAGDAATAQLLQRFGSIETWGNRVTKNGIVSGLHTSGGSTQSDLARVDLLVMFHDGTRRRDSLRLIRTQSGWQIDAASIPGNGGPDEP